MKALLVSEKIEFRKGQDPRESMGLGKRTEIVELFKEILDSADWINNINWTWENESMMAIPPGAKDFLEFDGWGEGFKRACNHILKKTGLDKYLFKPGKYSRDHPDSYKTVCYPIKDKYTHIFRGISVNKNGTVHTDFYRGFNESINFERGKSPISTMGIGIIESLPKIIFQEDLKSDHTVDEIHADRTEDRGTIHRIIALGSRILIQFYREDIRNTKTGKKITKINYAEKLVKSAGLENLFKRIYYEHHSSTSVYLTLVDEYKGSFKSEEVFYPEDPCTWIL